MPSFGQVALSMLFSIKNCTCMQILVTSSKNADMLLIPPIRNWTMSAKSKISKFMIEGRTDKKKSRIDSSGCDLFSARTRKKVVLKENLCLIILSFLQNWLSTCKLFSFWMWFVGHVISVFPLPWSIEGPITDKWGKYKAKQFLFNDSFIKYDYESWTTSWLQYIS